ncbi:phospholipase D family protein [Paraburkholderia sp. J94]|uniref:phospholipase D family protein n=1 Tax=Paraburkholderia sp. J94 TaxID=2805441 RepID=UPI002AAF7ABB|nr:phospholipase D family protein [Paraburkholderia sp. J94]
MLTLISNLHRTRKRNHLATLRKLFAGAERVVLCSGWLKRGGVIALLAELQDAVQRGVRVTVYSNRPADKQEETEEMAISELARLGIDHVIVEQDFYLHAKIYYFESQGRYHAVLGSANLTNGGLQRNEEVSVLLSGELGDAQHQEIADYLKHLDRRCRRAVNRRRKAISLNAT